MKHNEQLVNFLLERNKRKEMNAEDLSQDAPTITKKEIEEMYTAIQNGASCVNLVSVRERFEKALLQRQNETIEAAAVMINNSFDKHPIFECKANSNPAVCYKVGWNNAVVDLSQAIRNLKNKQAVPEKG